MNDKVKELNTEIRVRFSSPSTTCYNTPVKEWMINVEPLKSEVTEANIFSWIDNDYREWKYEKAPFGLYTKLLSLVLLSVPLPSKLLLDTARILSYYGHNELVISFLKKNERIISDDKEDTFTNLLGKAYKRSGSYDKAILLYRTAIKNSYEKDDKIRTAYHLTLLANLHADYMLKRGLQQFYYKVAYKMAILWENMFSKEFEKGDWELRALEICKLSYAKAFYHDNQDEVENLYESIIERNKENKGNIDASVRIMLEYSLANLEYVISTAPLQDIDFIMLKIKALKNQIENAHEETKNDIAFYIRMGQLIHLNRRLIERALKEKKTKAISKIFEELPQLLVYHLLDYCIHLARVYGDNKQYAFLVYEQAQWRLINISPESSSSQMYNKISEDLFDIRERLLETGTRGQFLYSSIYVEIELLLADILSRMHKYAKAVACYADLDMHFRTLVSDLEEEEKKILGQPKETLPPEYAILSEEQNFELYKFIQKNYRFLLQKTLHISGILTSVMFNDHQMFIEKLFSSAKKFNKHILKNQFNNIVDEIIGEETKAEDIVTELRVLEQNVLEVTDTVISLLRHGNNTDSAVNLINRTLSESGYNDIRDKIEVDQGSKSSRIQISMSKDVLSLIMKNIKANIIEAAKKNKVIKPKVRISITEKINGDRRVVYMVIEDNVKGTKELKEAINRVNSYNLNNLPDELTESGNGFFHIKYLINNDQPWDVINTSSSDMSKKLLIPIYETKANNKNG